jgi:hypothetical protein
MKIAEALELRASYQKEFESFQSRIKNSSTIFEGDTPAENPQSLIEQASKLINDLQELVLKIAQANATVKTRQGRTLLEAILEKEAYQKKHIIYSGAIDELLEKPDRYRSSELRIVRQLDPKSIIELRNQISAKIRSINTEIQEANWSNEI